MFLALIDDLSILHILLLQRFAAMHGFGLLFFILEMYGLLKSWTI